MTPHDGQLDGALPDLVMVDVQGDFDLAVADGLRDQLFDAMPGEGAVMAFDLSDCTHLDSVALGLIMDAHKLAHDRSCAVALICPDAPHPAVAPINMSSLRNVISVFPSRDDLHRFLAAFEGVSATEVLITSGQGSLARGV